MSDFNQDNRFSGGRGGPRYGGRDSGRRSFGDRDSERPMHRATCASCGNECEVPFRPSGERPVYCSNCFRKRNNDEGGSRESESRNDRRPRFEQRRTSSPSDGSGNAGGQISGQIAEQLKSLNFKLDKIISFLEPKVVETKVSEAKSEVPKVLEPKVKKPKVSKKKATEEK